MKKEFLFMALAAVALVGCKKDPTPVDPVTDLPEWYYTGGQLGTTTNTSSMTFRQPTPATEEVGLGTMFAQGDNIAEKDFVTDTTGRQHGLGPVYVRASCQHCHPNYSHGTSIPEGTYNAKDQGNGTLLVVINPQTQAYVPWLAGMPQLFGAAPFKAPLDPDQITVTWKTVTDKHGNKFPDGETYELRYPEVKMPNTAVYVYNQGYRDPDGLLESESYEVKLENTIGVYGTGLLDAITDEDIIAQYEKEANDKTADGQPMLKNGLNPAFWNGGFQTSGYYKNDPQWGPKRFTYALTRGPIMDAAGANAIWNITNVTRSDRRYHYLDLAGIYYATKSSQDKEVQAGFTEYINRVDPTGAHPEWHTGNLEKDIYTYLTSKQLDAEMTDAQYKNLMIWHRGLAVPAARNTTTEDFKKGKELFSQIGCANCHRPSWQTGEDHIQDPAKFFKSDSDMPRYPHQKIWPYTDFVQHRLWMKNDIRTGWCRTTPLWGRGLAGKTGSGVERLHDCRARNVLEAIMWHGCKNEGGTSDAYQTVVKFRNLSKKEREQLIYFIESI